jgi:protein-L-isoaspartate(D-aspartate) O-methyltransferase
VFAKNTKDRGQPRHGSDPFWRLPEASPLAYRNDPVQDIDAAADARDFRRFTGERAAQLGVTRVGPEIKVLHVLTGFFLMDAIRLQIGFRSFQKPSEQWAATALGVARRWLLAYSQRQTRSAPLSKWETRMTDAALQRLNMVESQVRPSDVTDRRITSAMSAVGREQFVPAALAAVAYMDDPLTLAPGRVLPAPRTFARLVQLAAVEAGDKVLDVGALMGYSAAVLGRMAHDVVALESDAALASDAVKALQAAGAGNVKVVTGPLAEGHAAAAPYDVIVIEGALELVPQELAAQLAAGGRLVAIEKSGGIGRAVVMQADGSGRLSSRIAFEASAPVLLGFERPAAFVF